MESNRRASLRGFPLILRKSSRLYLAFFGVRRTSCGGRRSRLYSGRREWLP